MIFKLLLLLHIYLALAGWVDPDTSPQSKVLDSYNDGRKHTLVFSDEFEVNDRLFKVNIYLMYSFTMQILLLT